MAKAGETQDRCTQYALDVVSGKITAGEYVRLACQRHLDDIEKSKAAPYKYYFDVEKSEEIINFAEELTIAEGEENEHVTAYPFQCFILGSLNGWRTKEKSYRRFRTSYVQLGSVNTYDADGNKTGTVDAETLKEMTTVNDDVSKLATGDNEQGTPQENAEDDENASNEDKATNPPTEQENGENGANTEPDKATEEQQEDKVIIPQGKMRVTVICDGSLNIRRSAAWGNDNICGRAIRGQSYYVKEIHVVDGKKMVRTIGDLYLSGESEHVQFEQL